MRINHLVHENAITDELDSSWVEDGVDFEFLASAMTRRGNRELRVC